MRVGLNLNPQAILYSLLARPLHRKSNVFFFLTLLKKGIIGKQIFVQATKRKCYLTHTCRVN